MRVACQSCCCHLSGVRTEQKERKGRCRPESVQFCVFCHCRSALHSIVSVFSHAPANTQSESARDAFASRGKTSLARSLTRHAGERRSQMINDCVEWRTRLALSPARPLSTSFCVALRRRARSTFGPQFAAGAVLINAMFPPRTTFWRPYLRLC